MPDIVGVTGPATTSVLAPAAFTARNWNVYATSLVRPVTTTQASWAPPGALSSIAVQSTG